MPFSKILKILFIFSLILFIGCNELYEKEKFRRPDWVPGKLFSTLSTYDNLSYFAEILQLSGLDTIIDVSGSYAVFAPTNSAVEEFLSERQYSALSDIPKAEITRIAKYHIVQNPWTHDQLLELSPTGWRSGGKGDVNSYAYKRQTILKDPNKKYFINRERNKEMIIADSISSDGYKKIFEQSRKYVPIFYDDYMLQNEITSEDFSFYFDRSFETGSVYFAGAKIIQSDIFAENGFLHMIDKVVEPLLSAEEILYGGVKNESYRSFLELINWYYPSFNVNNAATLNQYEVRLGGIVDTLWDLNYDRLAFNLHSELTGQKSIDLDYTLVNHNGIYAPTDEAFGHFIDEILTINSGYPHWWNRFSLPRDVIDRIILPHLNSIQIFPSSNSYKDIFNQEGFSQNEGDIIRKEYGSNCTFIGLDSYSPDRVFTSVTGPVFLRPSFSTFRLALLYARIEDDIAYNDGQFCFFPISDAALGLDSSLILDWTNQDAFRYEFKEYIREMKSMSELSRAKIKKRILNHVGIGLPTGSANKEYIPTIGGNYIIWNNANNTVQGNIPSTLGFEGDIEMINNPVELGEPADNGKSWAVNNWFNFKNVELRIALQSYSRFFELLDDAGLYNGASRDFNFLNSNTKYTVFVPSDEALNNFQTDILSKQELSDILMRHFLIEELIFTDNKIGSGSFETMSGDSLNIRTDPDLIEILDNEGNTFVSIREQEDKNNIMVSDNDRVMSVIHEINEVLVPFN